MYPRRKHEHPKVIRLEYTHSFACKALYENLCVFMYEQVGDGVFVASAGSGVAERPASG